MMRCSFLDLLGFMTLKIEIRYQLIWTDEIPLPVSDFLH